MNEQEIRVIVRDEMMKNYKDGDPKVPPHQHNGNDNLKLSVSNITEYLPFKKLGVGTSVDLVQTNLFFGGQYSYPLPVISGDLGAENIPFAGGDAPDGTIFIYKEAAAWQLWIMLFGTWHGVDLPLTP